MREKLIELLDMNCGYVSEMKAEELADYLLQNGVVVLPCKVYQTDGVRIYESRVTKVIYRTENFDFDEDAIGTSIFLTFKAKEIEPQNIKLEDTEQAAKDFILEIEQKYNVSVDYAYVDDNYWSTVNTLNDWRYMFESAAKIKASMPLADRPRMLTKLMAAERFKLIRGECEPLVYQLQNLVFDDKSEKAIVTKELLFGDVGETYDGSEFFYIGKQPAETADCYVVYFANNKKRYVPKIYCKLGGE